MCTSKVLAVITVCMLVTPPLAGAQQRGVDVPPPKLEKLEEGEAPAVTIRPGAEQQVTETREQGKVTSVKVKTRSSTYYVKPNTPAGTSQPGDIQSDSTQAPQFRVMEFDWKKPKPNNATARTAVLPPPEPSSTLMEK